MHYRQKEMVTIKGHSKIVKEMTPEARLRMASKAATVRAEKAQVKVIQDFAQRYGSWGCEECGWVYLPGSISMDNACARGRCTG